MSEKPIRISVKLFPGQDDDIIDWLSTLGRRERSAYIRMALRTSLRSAKLDEQPNSGNPLHHGPTPATGDKKDSTDSKEITSDLEAKINMW